MESIGYCIPGNVLHESIVYSIPAIEKPRAACIIRNFSHHYCITSKCVSCTVMNWSLFHLLSMYRFTIVIEQASIH